MQLVLIVEDDVILRASIARSLHRIPRIDVVEAGSVTEADRLLDELPVDLMLCDLQLPDGTSLELLPKLQRRDRRIPAVLVSGNARAFEHLLPKTMPVLEKPVSLPTLRDLVMTMLGCADAPSPFTVADYMQLAALGRHSLQLDVAQDGEPLGTVIIRDGESWTATDALGDGMDAFLRIITAPHPTISCVRPLTLGPRTLLGSCQQTLMESARILDERRAGKALPPKVKGARAMPVIHIPPRGRTSAAPIAIPNIPPVPERSGRLDLEEFDRLYDDGIDALIRKRYPEAFDLLRRAKAIRTTSTLEANLQRLRTLGFS